MMRTLLLILCICTFRSVAQSALVSGDYDELHIAYDNNTKTISGYYENGTGYDEQTGNARFSCIFYLEGKLAGKKAKIKTYYPRDSSDDVIYGELTINNDKTLNIHLPEEHGGCWNVEHFADADPAKFTLSNAHNWIQVRYAVKDKVYFHTQATDASIQKVYILKGDIVYIEQVASGWARCTFHGKKSTTGWIRLDELNALP